MGALSPQLSKKQRAQLRQVKATLDNSKNRCVMQPERFTGQEECDEGEVCVTGIVNTTMYNGELLHYS